MGPSPAGRVVSLPPARRAAHAALLVGGITLLARLAGFGRTLAFGRSVGTGCVGSVYTTANFVPNLVFDIVAGGMLSALVVPILAPALLSADRARADQLVSALLTWSLVVLVPVAVLVAVLAGPIVGLLLGGSPDCAGAHALGTRMLVVFAPQIVFYGLGVVLGGVLSAGERFTWPAVAPLLSSAVVIAVYLGYHGLAGPGLDANRLPRQAEVLLSVGTTLGVVVLTLGLTPAVWRSGTRWRPTLRFPSGVARRVRVAAVAGATTLAAQEISSAVMIRLANDSGKSTTVIVTVAQTLFLLPWAVFSLPIATTAFPRLSAEWQAGDRVAFQRRVGSAAGAVVVAAAAGTALLIAVAEPVGIVVLGPGALDLGAFAPAAVGFAVGLIGWSLVALLARALYACGQVVAAATAQVIGQLTVIVADVAISAWTAPAHRGVVLGVGNSIGVIVAAGLLILAGRRSGAFAVSRSTAADLARALLAGAAAAGAGWAVGRRATGTGTWSSLGLGVLAGVAVAAVFLAVLAALDRSMLTPVVRLIPGSSGRRAGLGGRRRGG